MKESTIKNFYRYEAVNYASTDIDGEYVPSKFPNPSVLLRVYNLWKETPKGYWIGYGIPDNLHGDRRWVSKTSRKRYAYPTKKEALINFIKRNERRVKILNFQILSSQLSIDIAKNLFDKID